MACTGCGNVCTTTCSGMCTGCSNQCGKECFGNCTETCISGCAGGCKTTCSGICDNGCTGGNNTTLYNSLKLSTLFEASNIQKIADWVASEATRRNNSPTSVAFAKNNLLTASNINKVITNLRKANQEVPLVEVDDPGLASLGQNLINGVKAAYSEKLAPVPKNQKIYLYNKGQAPSISGLTWFTNQLTYSYTTNYYVPGTGGTTGDEYLYIYTQDGASSAQNANIRTTGTIDFSQYKDYKLYVHFKSITFAYGLSNNGSGFEGLGITTNGNEDVFGKAKPTSILGISRPSGAYGNTSSNVLGVCKVSDLMTNPSNGYLYFIVVRPFHNETLTPQMQIDQIWLEK